jgi:hypothetical protein
MTVTKRKAALAQRWCQGTRDLEARYAKINSTAFVHVFLSRVFFICTLILLSKPPKFSVILAQESTAAEPYYAFSLLFSYD